MKPIYYLLLGLIIGLCLAVTGGYILHRPADRALEVKIDSLTLKYNQIEISYLTSHRRAVALESVLSDYSDSLQTARKETDRARVAATSRARIRYLKGDVDSAFTSRYPSYANKAELTMDLPFTTGSDIVNDLEVGDRYKELSHEQDNEIAVWHLYAGAQDSLINIFQEIDTLCQEKNGILIEQRDRSDSTVVAVTDELTKVKADRDRFKRQRNWLGILNIFQAIANGIGR